MHNYQTDNISDNYNEWRSLSVAPVDWRENNPTAE
jgi:hypothetical protein